MDRLIRFEIDKIVKNKFFLGILITSLIAVAGVFVFYFQMNTQSKSHRQTTETVSYDQIAKKYEGDFTEEKITEILSDYIKEYQKEAPDRKSTNMFSWYIVNTFLPDGKIYRMMSDAQKTGGKITIDQVRPLSIRDAGFSQFKTPLKLGNYIKWYDFIKLLGSVNLMVSILTVLICSFVFANDKAKHIEPLLLSTKYGRNKLTLAKIIASSVTSCVLFLFYQIIAWTGFLLYNKGFSGWDASIQTNFKLWQFSFPAQVNQLQVVLFSLFFQLCWLFLLVGSTLFISTLVKTPVTALAISLALFFLPLGSVKIIRTGWLNDLFNVFSINNSDAESMLIGFGRGKGLFFGSFSQNSFTVSSIALILYAIFSLTIFNKMKRARFG